LAPTIAAATEALPHRAGREESRRAGSRPPENRASIYAVYAVYYVADRFRFPNFIGPRSKYRAAVKQSHLPAELKT
jgi:hypothetical protein